WLPGSGSDCTSFRLPSTDRSVPGSSFLSRATASAASPRSRTELLQGSAHLLLAARARRPARCDRDRRRAGEGAVLSPGSILSSSQRAGLLARGLRARRHRNADLLVS